jgi:acyl dehydratase
MTAAPVRLAYTRRPSAIRYMVRAVLPVRRHLDLSPSITAEWRRHRVDARELAEFNRITGAATTGTETLPLLYPHVFGFRLAMAILTHPRFPVPIWGVLQTRNRLVQHRPLRVDDTLDFETRVLQGRAVPKGAEFDLHTTVRVDDTLAWESHLTFYTRGRFGEPAASTAAVAPPTEFGPTIAEWTMADAGHWRLGRCAGDYNGIHFWDAYARRLGFPRALYHPPRVLGECLSRLSLAAAPTLVNDDDHSRRQVLEVWLKGPVSHGARVKLHAATEEPSVCAFALYAGGDARPAIVGRWRRGGTDTPQESLL